jgi:hypothetical protein
MNHLPDGPICDEDARLLEEYAAATEDYFDAIKTLQQSKSETGILQSFEAVTDARRHCVAAREALERHRGEHGGRMVRTSARAPTFIS